LFFTLIPVLALLSNYDRENCLINVGTEGGFDSIHWSEICQPSAPDDEIMDYASAHGLVVFTHDLDFGALLVDPKTRQPSVIQVRTQDTLPTVIGELVLRALRSSRSHLEGGALVTVDLNRHRIRLLPI
jgi:predicted nuclease of predicted toxin-antitoxin system